VLAWYCYLIVVGCLGYGACFGAGAQLMSHDPHFWNYYHELHVYQRWNKYSICRVRVEYEYRKSHVESKYESWPAVLEYNSEYRYSSTSPSTSKLDSSPSPSPGSIESESKSKYNKYKTKALLKSWLIINREPLGL